MASVTRCVRRAVFQCGMLSLRLAENWKYNRNRGLMGPKQAKKRRAWELAAGPKENDTGGQA